MRKRKGCSDFIIYILIISSIFLIGIIFPVHTIILFISVFVVINTVYFRDYLLFSAFVLMIYIPSCFSKNIGSRVASLISKIGVLRYLGRSRATNLINEYLEIHGEKSYGKLS